MTDRPLPPLEPSKLDGVMAVLLSKGANVELLGIFTTDSVSVALLEISGYRGYAPFSMTVAEKLTPDHPLPMGATPRADATTIEEGLRMLAQLHPQLKLPELSQ